MRFFIVLGFAALLSIPAYGNSIDPETTEFPWKNGPTRDAVYKLSDHPNKVHVFEVFANYCGWCQRNAEQVAELASEYADDERVQVIDLGLDTNEREIQRWIARHQPAYPVVQDVGHSVYNALKQANGIPQTFVVNCLGELEGYTVGYWGSTEIAEIHDAIARAKEVTCE